VIAKPRNAFGLNGATLPTSDILTGIRVAGAAGFCYYEPRIPELDGSQGQIREGTVFAALKDAAVDWLPLNALEGLFSSTPRVLNEDAKRTFALAARFGVKTVIAVPGPAGGSVDRAEAVLQLGRLNAMAKEHGVSLLYEFLGFPHCAFPSLDAARTLAAEAELPLVLDTFHLAVGQTPRHAIERLHASEIGLIHLSDALASTGDLTGVVDADRVLPGEGQLALSEIVRAIQSTGYDGPVSVEVFHPMYGERAPEDVAVYAFRRATALLAGAVDGTGARKGNPVN